ncbi:hypothetical protein Dimus_003423 [Dionaea muscipula]
MPGIVSHLSTLSDDVSLCGGGMVSEEGRALPVARGALRPQPTDGLWRPLSSPVEPVSAVAGGVGLDGRSDGRSYAHVVQVSILVNSGSIHSFHSISVGFVDQPFPLRGLSSFEFMVGRTRGSSQLGTREPAYDLRSSVRRPVLFRGSPSPRPPGYRREPPSPGLRP